MRSSPVLIFLDTSWQGRGWCSTARPKRCVCQSVLPGHRDDVAHTTLGAGGLTGRQRHQWTRGLGPPVDAHRGH